MSCLSCILNRKRSKTPSETKIYTPPQNCTYSKEQLEGWLHYKNSWIQSQLNIYDSNCNKFEKQITSFLKTQGVL